MDGSELTIVDPLTGMRTKLYKCSECGTTLSQKCHLRAHMRIHSGEKPFRCEECGAAFAEKGNLGRHLRIHANDRPYACHVCGDVFAHMGSLSRHRRVKHKIQKQFRCNICGSMFAQTCGLQLHLRVKHSLSSSKPSTNLGPFVCVDCGVTYSEPIDFAIHPCNKNKLKQDLELSKCDTPIDNDAQNDIYCEEVLAQSLMRKLHRHGTTVQRRVLPTHVRARSDMMVRSDIFLPDENEKFVHHIAADDTSKIYSLLTGMNVQGDSAVTQQKNKAFTKNIDAKVVANGVNAEGASLKHHDGNKFAMEVGDCSSKNEESGKIVSQLSPSVNRECSPAENKRLKLENWQLKVENKLLKSEISRLKLENEKLKCKESENSSKLKLDDCC